MRSVAAFPRHANRTRKPRPKAARFIRWLTSPLSPNNSLAAIRIICGRVIRHYYVREFDAPEGRAFELEVINVNFKHEDRTRYAVFFHQNGQDRSCECLGFEKWGHCKHIEGLAALLAHQPPPAAIARQAQAA